MRRLLHRLLLKLGYVPAAPRNVLMMNDRPVLHHFANDFEVVRISRCEVEMMEPLFTLNHGGQMYVIHLTATAVRRKR